MFDLIVNIHWKNELIFKVLTILVNFLCTLLLLFITWLPVDILYTLFLCVFLRSRLYIWMLDEKNSSWSERMSNERVQRPLQLKLLHWFICWVNIWWVKVRTSLLFQTHREPVSLHNVRFSNRSPRLTLSSSITTPLLLIHSFLLRYFLAFTFHPVSTSLVHLLKSVFFSCHWWVEKVADWCKTESKRVTSFVIGYMVIRFSRKWDKSEVGEQFDCNYA